MGASKKIMVMDEKGKRDARLITIPRGGVLRDEDHRLLAVWAADCAEHVRHLFEKSSSTDRRPNEAIQEARAWARGEITMAQARKAATAAHAAARDASGAARAAARAAGHAVAVAHMADNELGAAAYAIRAVRETVALHLKNDTGREEWRWQRDQLPDAIRELVLEDQRLRNAKFGSLFGD